MPNPMKTLLPLAAGLVLGTWFAKRPVPPQARTLCPPAGQAGIRRQMEQLKREYEKQDRMRRDFTANVSHELKTPLTSISGYAEIIREGMVKSGKPFINLLPLDEGETITTVMKLPECEDDCKDMSIMFATSQGNVRRNSLMDFVNVQSNGKIAMKLDEGDRKSVV